MLYVNWCRRESEQTLDAVLKYKTARTSGYHEGIVSYIIVQLL